MSAIKPWANSTAYWMQEGPDQDVVLSSRIRLARNIVGLPYPNFQSDQQAEEIIAKIQQALPRLKEETEKDWQILSITGLSESARGIMVDKHLMSPALAEREKQGALLLRDDEAVSIMLNEEDHLRIQVLHSGLQLEKAWNLADKLDDILESQLDFAFSDTYGYKTACPTNAGTGLRASVMMHLPALAMSQKLGPLLTSMTKLGIVARGLYGEGSEAFGHIYQISNQISLGKPEKEILASLQALIRQIINEERKTRKFLFSRIPIQLQDKVGRTLGMVKNSYIMQNKEAIRRLSDLRFGLELGILDNLSYEDLNHLMVKIQDAWLNREEDDQDENRKNRPGIKRAQLLRESLAEVNIISQ